MKKERRCAAARALSMSRMCGSGKMEDGGLEKAALLAVSSGEEISRSGNVGDGTQLTRWREFGYGRTSRRVRPHSISLENSGRASRFGAECVEEAYKYTRKSKNYKLAATENGAHYTPNIFL